MKHFFIFTVLFLGITSCNPDQIDVLEVGEIEETSTDFWYDDEVYKTILTEGSDIEVFRSYLLAFIADAKRHNVDLSHVDIYKSIFELVESDVIGARGSCDPTYAHIIWNTESWKTRNPLNKIDEPYKIYLFWHEFGHDLLGLDHLCRSGHIMTGRHTVCRGDGNEGDEINLYGLKYSTDEEVRDFRRAVDDMFGMVDQIYLECRTSFTSKGQIETSSCNMNF